MSLSKRWSAAPAFGVLLCATLAMPAVTHASSCTTQGEMTSTDRDMLAATGQRLASAVINQDTASLRAALLPSVVSDWDGIRDAIEQGAPAVKGGHAELRSLYLMDATTQKAAEDTQFFCSNASGSTTVSISMRALPPGRYAVILADAPGSQLGGQMGFILGWDSNAWKIGGAFVRPGMLDGHDGVWYWEHARQMAQADSPWGAYFCYEAARYLLLPVDFISSPNLDKLGQEEGQLKHSPADAFPLSVTVGDRTWKIGSMRFDPSLRQADLGATYESAGVTDPAAQRTEAIAVLGALLKAQPALRQSFHGMWAYASNGGKVTPVMELPMAQIP